MPAMQVEEESNLGEPETCVATEWCGLTQRAMPQRHTRPLPCKRQAVMALTSMCLVQVAHSNDYI